MLSCHSLAQCWSWASHCQALPVHRSSLSPRSPPPTAPLPSAPTPPFPPLYPSPPTPLPPPIPPPPPICPAHRELHLAHHDHDLPPALDLAHMLQVAAHRNSRAVGLLPLNVLFECGGNKGTKGEGCVGAN